MKWDDPSTFYIIFHLFNGMSRLTSKSFRMQVHWVSCRKIVAWRRIISSMCVCLIRPWLQTHWKWGLFLGYLGLFGRVFELEWCSNSGSGCRRSRNSSLVMELMVWSVAIYNSNGWLVTNPASTLHLELHIPTVSVWAFRVGNPVNVQETKGA